MAVRQVRVGDVLRPNRRWIKIDHLAEYVAIGVRAFGRGIFRYDPTPGSELGKLRFFKVQPGSLVVSNIKAWEGAVDVSGSSDEGTIASNRFLSYEPIDAQANVNFLRHYFLTEAGNQKLQRASPGSADRNRTLAASRFEDILVPLPSPPEQQRIAARLDRIGETSHASKDLEDFELTWRHLVDRLTLGSHSPPQRIGDGLQPKAMELVHRDSAYQIAGVYSFGRGLLSRGTIKGADTKYKSFTRLDHNDLVYSKLGAFEGAVAVVPGSYENFYVSPEFPVFEVLDGVDPIFLRYCVIAESFVRQLVGATSGVGARQKRVSPGAFLDLSVPMPSLDRQREIARRLDLASRTLELKRDAVRIRKALFPAARNEAFARLT